MKPKKTHNVEARIKSTTEHIVLTQLLPFVSVLPNLAHGRFYRGESQSIDMILQCEFSGTGLAFWEVG